MAFFESFFFFFSEFLNFSPFNIILRFRRVTRAPRSSLCSPEKTQKITPPASRSLFFWFPPLCFLLQSTVESVLPETSCGPVKRFEIAKFLSNFRHFSICSKIYHVYTLNLS